VAIVTGAGTGIGKAISSRLVRDGFVVALAGRRAGVLEDACAEIGSEAFAVPADVSDETSVQAMFATVVRRCGRVDLLVNNAGISAPAVPFEDMELDGWQRVVDANLTGVFLCMREAFRVMKAQTPQGGRIINNGSISAMTPRPRSAPYTATKHGVAGLTKSGALDGRACNIAVGEIDIGNAATAMTGAIQAGTLQADGSLSAEPTMSVEDVARAVGYMASLPLSANVLTMTVMASAMPFVGRG
jgi:NAD(P)-dependent dehydrogenase (short-subunit alcohol dehydrogenase family)